MTGERRTFGEFLDAEVEKVVLFFLHKQGTLAKSLALLRMDTLERIKGPLIFEITTSWIEETQQKYRDLANEVL